MLALDTILLVVASFVDLQYSLRNVCPEYQSVLVFGSALISVLRSRARGGTPLQLGLKHEGQFNGSNNMIESIKNIKCGIISSIYCGKPALYPCFDAASHLRMSLTELPIVTVFIICMHAIKLIIVISTNSHTLVLLCC